MNIPKDAHALLKLYFGISGQLPRKLYQHRPQIAKTHFCVINVDDIATSARSSTQFFSRHTNYNGTLQWHPAMAFWCHLHSPKVGPPSSPPTIAHYNGTLQWHPGATSNLPKLAHHSTLQWHPAMAPSNGILVPPPLPQSWPTIVSPRHSTPQWHPAMAPCNGSLVPRPLPQSWPTIVSPHHSTMAPCNGTQQWHPAMAPWCHVVSPHHSTLQWHPAMAPWCHVHSPKVGPPSSHPAMAPCNGSLVPRPRPLPQSWPTIVSPHHST